MITIIMPEWFCWTTIILIALQLIVNCLDYYKHSLEKDIEEIKRINKL